MKYYDLLQKVSPTMRWQQHPENPSLSQLEFKQCGMWYTIEGTTVNSVADAQKFVLMQRHAKNLNLI